MPSIDVVRNGQYSMLDTHHTPNNSDKELLLKEKYRVSVFKSEREQEMKEEKRQQMIT